jgi:L-ribulose-5-phosphate 3-epimerase/hexulose-6-phosphate isomerase
MFEAAARSGFQFVEMSVDESADRLSRLTWSLADRNRVAAAAAAAGTPIYSMCLSGHRRYGLGSADPSVRTEAARILDAAIGLAADLGIRVIQIAGYFAYYEAASQDAEARYVAGLRAGLGLAAQRGVMLAVENIDTGDMASADDAVALATELASPWFQVYPDVGNFAVHDLDVVANVRRVLPYAVGLHLKDARPGEPRRVPFGEGTVPFDSVFQALLHAGYSGPLTIEMWNDDPTTAERRSSDALAWIRSGLRAADAQRISA